MKFQLIHIRLQPVTVGLCLGALISLFSSVSAHAMPAEPSWHVFQQPKEGELSGFQFTGRAQGDEWLDWYETKDGKIFLQNPKTHAYEYAVRKDGGSAQKDALQLSLSGILVGTPAAKIPDVSRDDLLLAWEEARLRDGAVFPLGTGEPRPAKWRFPTLIFRVNFADSQHSVEASYYHDKVFGTEPFTVNHYYADVSRGRAQFDPAPESQEAVNDGVVSVLLDYDHPNPYQLGRDRGARTQLVHETLFDVLTRADPYIDFARFDLNADGGLSRNELQLIFIWARPRGPEQRHVGVWPHAWFISRVEAQFDGVRVGDPQDDGTYSIMGEYSTSTYPLRLTELGTYVHELGHSAFNLSDLYHAPADVQGWGVMGSGWGGDPPGSQPVHMLGSTKVIAGFIEPKVVLPTPTLATLTLPPHQSPWYQVVKIPTHMAEYYFILEHRRAAGIYDSALEEQGAPWDHGLMITFVRQDFSQSTHDSHFIQGALGFDSISGLRNLFSLEGNRMFGPDTRPDSRIPAEMRFDPRKATGVQVNLDREQGDSLIVSVTLGTDFTCQEYTSTNPVHVANDRVYVGQVRGDGGWEDKYYAVGSEDDLGFSRTQLITLSDDRYGDYYLNTCGPPVVREVRPPSVTELNWAPDLGQVIFFRANVWDREKDIARVDFRLDNGPWQAGSSYFGGEGETLPFFHYLPHDDVPAGSHEIQVRAFDAEGHMSNIFSSPFQLEP